MLQEGILHKSSISFIMQSFFQPCVQGVQVRKKDTSIMTHHLCLNKNWEKISQLHGGAVMVSYAFTSIQYGFVIKKTFSHQMPRHKSTEEIMMLEDTLCTGSLLNLKLSLSEPFDRKERRVGIRLISLLLLLLFK